MTRVRTATVAIAAAGVVLAAAACGGSPSGPVAQVGSTAGRSTSAPSAASGAVSFSRCMRSHGVLAFPDPAAGGTIPKESLQQLGVSSARYQSAQRSCRSLLPNGGRPPDRAQLEQAKAQGLRFAQCMRAHGVPNMPDPDGSGRIPDPASVHIDQGAPAYQAANQACAADRPPYMPSNAAYNAWAASHSGSGS